VSVAAQRGNSRCHEVVGEKAAWGFVGPAIARPVSRLERGGWPVLFEAGNETIAMSDRYPPSLQREELTVFASALGSAASAFRRDECGDPRINGKRGHVYAVPEGFQLYCVCESRKAWTYAKRALAFARVTQDGDEEGMLIMDRLPTTEEAEVIRAYLGINKTREISEEHLAKLRAGLQRSDERAKNSLSREGPASSPSEAEEADFEPASGE
jgi:hypothetical protein